MSSTNDGEDPSTSATPTTKEEMNATTPSVVTSSNKNEGSEKAKEIFHEKMEIDQDKAVTPSDPSVGKTTPSVNTTSMTEKEEGEVTPNDMVKTEVNSEPAKTGKSNAASTAATEVKADKSPEDTTMKDSESKATPAGPPISSSTVPATTTSTTATTTTTKSTKSSSAMSSTTSSSSSTNEKTPPSLGTKNPAAVATSTSSSTSGTTTTAAAARKKKMEKVKKQSKKRKAGDNGGGTASRRGSNDSQVGATGDESTTGSTKKPGPRKGKKKKKTGDRDTDSVARKSLSTSTSKEQESTTSGKSKKSKKGKLSQKYSPAQAAVKDMMRQLLEEDRYSQKGSVVEIESTDDEDDERTIYAIASGTASSSKRGTYGADATISMLRLDRASITRAMRKRLRIEEMRGMMDTSGVNKKRANSVVVVEDHHDNRMNATDDNIGDSDSARGGRKKKRKKAKRNVRAGIPDDGTCMVIGGVGQSDGDDLGFEKGEDGTNEQNEMGFEESSIFGQTTGSSNATWVECDKCKKWRRLRGVVDAKKLPAKWYCSMNKTDPERAKCSAPEEEYENTNTPENVTDQRIRKHLRLWVRRLQTNEQFESRLPTMTRGKRRNTTTSSKEPYEWVRCCNPSCGKWRALLKSMDASSIIEAAKNGEWYCVLNTWDEKTASCAAPQENLPAIGCPPWVMRNEN